MVDTKDFSTILSGLLNDFPAIGAREIRFGELGDKSGVGIYPSAAATVISETTDIMGGVYQKCNYAVQVVYRAVPQSETDRIHIKGWLDKLARWLEKQPITADGQQHTLAAWPDLGDGRTITAFVQVSAAYLAGRDVRALPYMHWWTFIGYYMEIGDCTFSTILDIRRKLRKHKKLEKWEREYYDENRELIEFKSAHLTDDEDEFIRQLMTGGVRDG